jgi:hypothetical protein
LITQGAYRQSAPDLANAIHDREHANHDQDTADGLVGTGQHGYITAVASIEM